METMQLPLTFVFLLTFTVVDEKIVSLLEELKQMARQNNSVLNMVLNKVKANTETVEELPSDVSLPLSTYEDLVELEEKLNSSEVLQKQLVINFNILKSLGPNDVDICSAKYFRYQYQNEGSRKLLILVRNV